MGQTTSFFGLNDKTIDKKNYNIKHLKHVLQQNTDNDLYNLNKQNLELIESPN